jgi:hypothetical protein
MFLTGVSVNNKMVSSHAHLAIEMHTIYRVIP